MSTPSTLRVALVGGPMYDGLYETIPDFEKTSAVHVEVVARLPHPELNAFVKQALESGVRIDVISTHTKYAPSQASWLRPLDDLLPPDLVSDLLPRTLELSRIDGRLMQVPRNVDVRLLHYRRDLIPTPPSTWDELVDLAAHRTRVSHGRNPVFGFLFPGRSSGLFAMFYELLVSAGGRLFDDRLRPAFDTQSACWAVDQIVKMHHQLRITPRDLAQWHYDEISKSFRVGDAAMVSDWPGSYHLYRDPVSCPVSDRVAFALLPKGPAGIRAADAGCHSFAITRETRQPEAAAAFIGHLTSPASQLGEARRGSIPSRANILAEARSESSGDQAAAHRWSLLAEAEGTMSIVPRFAAYPLCENAIWRNVQRAMLGELSAANAVQRAAAEVDAIVSGQTAGHGRERD
jgi:multiple sugar transport system substrate-binding protein